MHCVCSLAHFVAQFKHKNTKSANAPVACPHIATGRYCNQVNMDHDMRLRLHEYFEHCRQLFKNRYYMDVLADLSPTLRGEVTRGRYQAWIDRIPFFRVTNTWERKTLCMEVTSRLKPEAFAPNELLYRQGQIADRLFIIERGLVAETGVIMRKGQFFGEDAILLRTHKARRRHNCTSLSYLHLYTLSRDNLRLILEQGDLPEAAKMVQKYAAMVALRAYMRKVSLLWRVGNRFTKVCANATGAYLLDLFIVDSASAHFVYVRTPLADTPQHTSPKAFFEQTCSLAIGYRI